jgi:hypothetical protein
VVPLWFVWLDDGLFASSRQGSQVWRNVVRDPRVAVQLEWGRSWTEQAGVLLSGTARPVAADHPAGKRALSAWFEKYRQELAGGAFARYAERVHEPVMLHVTPEHLATWDHALRTGA